MGDSFPLQGTVNGGKQRPLHWWANTQLLPYLNTEGTLPQFHKRHRPSQWFTFDIVIFQFGITQPYSIFVGSCSRGNRGADMIVFQGPIRLYRPDDIWFSCEQRFFKEAWNYQNWKCHGLGQISQKNNLICSNMVFWFFSLWSPEAVVGPISGGNI